MDSPDYSSDNFGDSEEEIKGVKPSGRPMTLRGRQRKSYIEHAGSDDSGSEELEEEGENPKKIKQNPDVIEIEDQGNEEVFNEDPSGTNQDENYEEPYSGVFSPDIDQILWRREKIDEDGTRTMEYYVKYKDYSYLHCQWFDESQLLNLGKNFKSKLNRFNKTFEKKMQDQEEYESSTAEGRFFDPSYIEVDRIIYSTELFPVIHPKKGNELKGKWSEYLAQVVSILLNYTKNNIHYGIYFMEPVDPERDNAPNYRKVITNPMDLGTCLNRVYLDFYKNSSQFWTDIGFIFKNCRKFNKDPAADIRVLCDTLREIIIELYKQWYAFASNKYEKLLNEFKEKQKFQSSAPQTQMVDEKDDMKKRQIEKEFKSKEDEVHNILSQFETFQNKTFMNSTNNNPSQLQFQLNQFINSNPLMFNSKISFDDITKSIQTNTSLEELNKLKNKPITPMNMAPPAVTPDVSLKKQEMTNIITTKFEQNVSLPEVELWNPGEFNFRWLIDDKATVAVEEEERYYLQEEDLQELSLMNEVDKLYFVKWKNLSYTDSTWEPESLIANPQKINDFRFFNRALDKESRLSMMNQVNRHKTYMDILNNPKKKAKCSAAYINDLKNKLYFYDVALKREPIQYTFKNQPIFKDQKLLRDYQLESLNWLIQAWYHKRNVILADEMGLGKTVQSIAFLNHLNNFEGCRGPFLVIAPLSTLDHWKRTGEIWTNLNSILYYDGNSIEGRSTCRGYEWFYIDVLTKGSLAQTSELYKFQILITSYEVFLQDLNTVFLQIPFQFIVVDEAHRLKNTNAKILNSLKKLACKRILLLTGTPIQNNTEELWSLLNYIEPEKFYSLQAFMADFGDLSNTEQLEKLHKMVKPYLLRRKKEDVERSIPPLQETIIDVEMTTIQKTIYKTLYDKNKQVLSKGVINSNFATSLNNLEMQLRKCCNHPFLIKEIEGELTKECFSQEDKMNKLVESSGKMILLDKLLPKMKNEGKKVLIFSQFTQMLALLEDYLRARGYRYEKIDGAVKSKERQTAIDRFNDPTKKRDVFLLSTKAGGLGINLTSANIVVIFDSDWNPQNDVQATARAHRIGQQSEVLVYRLITSKTYEAEMFEKASKKLGLDQAIFMGGVFQSTKDEPKTRDKMNKQEVETLLKKGILGLINDDNKESQRFMEQDIDDILTNNTHIAKVSMLSGSYTFQKSSFVSEKTDVNLDVNDPNFWNMVLKNQESATKQLLDELESGKEMKNYEEQKIYMLKLSEAVYKVIENKLNVEGYNADDEKNVMDVLNIILTSKTFHKTYRDFALNWSYEIAKPSRRNKKIQAHEFEVSKGSKTENTTSRTRNAKKGEGGSDEEQVFGDEGDDVGGEEEFHNFEEEDDDGELANKKMSNKMKEELLRKLCNYCERTKCTFYCQGYCKRSFHEICKDKVDQGITPGLDKNVINFEIPETKMEEEKLKKSINLDFICSDCQKNVALCFKCKKKGKFYPELSSSKSKSKAKPTADKDESLASDAGDDKTEADSVVSSKQEQNGKFNELIKCSTANCNKFYHLNCIQDNPLFKFFDANKHKKFRCALHYCAKCKISGDTMAIAQCFRCPKSYHLKCYAKDKILKVTKKIIICQDHEFEVKQTAKEKEKENKEKEGSGTDKKKSKDKNGTQLKIEKNSDNTMVIKVSKNEEKGPSVADLQPEEDYDDFKIPKNKKAKKREEKLVKKEKEAEKKNERNIMLSFKVGDEVVVSDVVASISSKLKRKIESGEYQKPKKQPAEREKLTYEELKIETPEEFDYENYDRDWCRYCGARYSSNFTKGPWGSRTLCTIHYIDWNQKKTLNLSAYKDLPKRPIKAEVNTELPFLQRLLVKNDQAYTPELLESLIPSKKVKRAVENDINSDELSKTEQKSPGEIDNPDAMEEEVD